MVFGFARSLKMSGETLTPFALDKFPFIKINQAGLGGSLDVSSGTPVPTGLQLALSLTVGKTVASGVFALDIKTSVSFTITT